MKLSFKAGKYRPDSRVEVIVLTENGDVIEGVISAKVTSGVGEDCILHLQVRVSNDVDIQVVKNGGGA